MQFSHFLKYLDLNYGSLEQVKHLIANSRGSCYQEITLDCLNSPIRIDGTNYVWWLDNEGKRQYFIDGAYQNATKHICQCGHEESCDSCNCDAMSGSWLQDNGRITADWLLPITGFSYQQPYDQMSHLRLNIGELICTGRIFLFIT